MQNLKKKNIPAKHPNSRNSGVDSGQHDDDWQNRFVRVFVFVTCNAVGNNAGNLFFPNLIASILCSTTVTPTTLITGMRTCNICLLQAQWIGSTRPDTSDTPRLTHHCGRVWGRFWGRFWDRFWNRFWGRVWGRFWSRFWGRPKTLTTVWEGARFWDRV
jgi:hypothetical protein